MGKPFVSIEKSLLRKAFDYFLENLEDEVVQIDPTIVEELSEFVTEGDPAGDPSVGIYADYDALWLLRELQARLRGEKSCTNCDPDTGVLYHDEHREECKALNGLGYDCDSAHYEVCPVCEGKIFVSMFESAI